MPIGLVKDGVLRIVNNPEDEDTTGWSPVELPAGYDEDAYRWDGEQLVLDWSRFDADLCSRIDTEAERARQRFITPGAGQAMEYQEAVAQARACLAEEPGPFPMLSADVVAGTIDPRTGEAIETDEEAADLVLFMYQQWLDAGAAIRAARLGAKAAIRTAETAPAKRAAAAVDWQALLP